MGIYLVRHNKALVESFKYNKQACFQNKRMSHEVCVESLDGLVLYIRDHKLLFVADNYELLQTSYLSEVESAIEGSPFIGREDKLIQELNHYVKMEESFVYKEAGDLLYDSGKLEDCLNYYAKAQIGEAKDLALCNIGLVYLQLGLIKEGLGLIEEAYKVAERQAIWFVLLRCHIVYKKESSMTHMADNIQKILEKPSDDHGLSFLVWYYHYMGDIESSLTSYMQLKSYRYRFNLLDYYMRYMIESNQLLAMESFLKPLREMDGDRYHLALASVYMELGSFKQALKELEYKFSVYHENRARILQSESLCHENRMIESMESINKINVNFLKPLEIQDYYIQLARLSSKAKDFSKEYESYMQLCNFWQSKYRKVFLGILDNMKWKVK
jgi:tetratricopeptide (TPR) repeat protein